MSDVFLESAADLLAEPDPGPTPFVVDGLIVENCIAAIQGPPKASKTWTGLELAMSVVTGLPAFDTFAVLQGPAAVILEESGRAALHRRLDALARGRAIEPERLRELHFAANRRVRLNDPEWQKRILDDVAKVKPRIVIFDPLVRLKGATTKENDQDEMAPILDFMRLLRDEAETAVVFVAHTGHNGSHMRGTSDLEGYWESKLALRRLPDRTITVAAEHREAEVTEPFTFRQAWDQHGSLRLKLLAEPAQQEEHEPVASEDERERLRLDAIAALRIEAPLARDKLKSAIRAAGGVVGRNANELLADLASDPASGIARTSRGFQLAEQTLHLDAAREPDTDPVTTPPDTDPPVSGDTARVTPLRVTPENRSTEPDEAGTANGVNPVAGHPDTTAPPLKKRGRGGDPVSEDGSEDVDYLPATRPRRAAR
jgi:hypothetical protein